MRKTFNKLDKPLLVLMVICLVFGILMVGSASSLKAYMTFGDSYHYLKRQLLFIFAGLFLSFIVIKTPLKKYNNTIYLGVIGIIAAMAYVLVKGEVSNGIKGWLFIGGFGIQPSEFAKTVNILFLALTFEKVMKNKNASPVELTIPFLVPIIFVLMIYVQKDFGTMLVILGITAVIFFVIPYEKKIRLFIMSLVLGMLVITIPALLLSGKGLTDTQKERFNFKNPCTRYREQSGYQVCNGYIAINTGSLTGSGFGNSKQKYLYLPEAHTDFIFAIIIEETGLISGVLIILAYFLIIWRILLIGRKSYTLQGSIISYGVATYIALHVLINLGGVLGVIPLTGIPLPFYSYGGSFMLNLLICLGLVQRVCVENKIFEQKHIVR